MNSHALYEANNMRSVDSINKRYGNAPNISEMEDTGLQDGVDIDYMLYASKIHQYINMECNNESDTLLVISKFSPLKNHQF